MTNKKLILGITTIIILTLVLIIIFTLNKSATPNPLNTGTERSYKNCAKEGETIGAQGMPETCCPGLKPVGGWPGGYQGDCSIPPPPTGLSICAKCGDDICDTYNGENKCNCPEDCTGDEKHCIRNYQTVKINNSESCCPGLKAIKIAHYEDDCSVTPSTVGASRMACFKCGDGHCDEGVYLENKCNCPEDCK